MRRSAVLGDALADMACCLQFFSRLPVPAPTGAAPAFGLAIRMLPVAGMVIGLCGALPLAAGALAGWPHPMVALAAVAAGVLATGGLHEDGLADTADGLGGGGTRERKLAIMRDSRIGSYGVVALIIAIGWRVMALSALLDRWPLSTAMLVVVAGAAVSRGLALLPLATLNPARADGLGRGVGPLDRGALVVCFVLTAVTGIGAPLLAGFHTGHALLAAALATLAAGLVTHLAARQIGGHTGDIAGACQQVAEAAFLGGLLLFPATA